MSAACNKPKTSYGSSALRSNSQSCGEAKECGVFWMLFQKHRLSRAGLSSAMSWPISRPAGLSSLELGYGRRTVSTTESRSRNLPPIANKILPGNRKARVKATTHAKDRESWANNWANVRAQQTDVYANGASANSQRKDTLGCATNPNARSARKNVQDVPMNEKEAVLFKRLKGIYANSTEKFVRVERLQSSINALQSRTLHSEIECSLKEYKKKIDNDKCSRSELKRVRDRYYKDKERRKKHSHVSLNALECPQVSRHAYGLPEEGQELGTSNVTQTARKQLFDIWQRATKRAANVSKLLHGRNEEKPSLPEITVRSRPKRFQTSREEARQDSVWDSSHNLETVIGALHAAVLLESDEEDLLDIVEKNE